MFHVKRRIIHTYKETQIDYGILAATIYKKLKEEKENGNQTDKSQDSQFYGLQGA